MQSIGRKTKENKITAKNAEALGSREAVSGVEFVLPKFLRKPVRRVNRLVKGGFRISQGAVLGFGFCIIATLGSAGIVFNDKQDVVVAQMNVFNFLKINHYDISGNKELNDLVAVELLTPKNGESLLGYDVTKARDALKTSPWVADASVTKVYPNKIAVNIEERSVFAIWQNANDTFLIDREGRSLAAYDGRANDLPIIVGKGAAKTSSLLLDSLSRYPDVAMRVKTHVRVGNRRWDLHMDNGVLVMLPEMGVDSEIQRLAILNKEQGLLERDISQIDMRLSDRLVLKLSDDSARMRAVSIEERKKVLKTAGKGRHL